MNITVTIFEFGKNKNGRVYDKIIAEEIIEQSKFLVDNGVSHGELTNYENTNSSVNTNNISHLVTRLFITENSLKAEIEILDLPFGRLLKEELDLFCFVPRGIGNVDLSGNIYDYQFVAIDAILKRYSSF